VGVGKKTICKKYISKAQKEANAKYVGLMYDIIGCSLAKDFSTFIGFYSS